MLSASTFYEPLVIALLTVFAGCSGDSKPSQVASRPDADAADASPSSESYMLDLRNFDPEGGITLRGDAIAFRPDLDVHTKIITAQADGLRKVYNRLPCGNTPDQAFRDVPMTMASARPVQLDSIEAEIRDDDTTGNPVDEICLAYHATDGRWHGIEGIPTVHDASAKVSRGTIQVGADHVDIIGVGFGGGVETVNWISFVARRE